MDNGEKGNKLMEYVRVPTRGALLRQKVKNLHHPSTEGKRE